MLTSSQEALLSKYTTTNNECLHVLIVTPAAAATDAAVAVTAVRLVMVACLLSFKTALPPLVTCSYSALGLGTDGRSTGTSSSTRMQYIA